MRGHVTHLIIFQCPHDGVMQTVGLSDSLKNSQHQCPPDPIKTLSGCLELMPGLQDRSPAAYPPCLHVPLWPKVEAGCAEAGSGVDNSQGDCPAAIGALP